MGRIGRWFERAACLAPLAVAAGCQAGGEQTPVEFSRTPPTVQVAYNEDHGGTLIKTVTRTTRAGQDYYTVRYSAADGSRHDVVYNEAGEEVERH